MITKNKIIMVTAALIIAGGIAVFSGGESKSTNNYSKTLTQGKDKNINVNSSKFDNWTLSCVELKKNKNKSCRLLQQAVWQKSKRNALTTVFLVPAKQGKEKVAIMKMIAPLGVNLITKMEVTIDDGKALNVPFEACGLKGCFVTMLVKDQFIDKIKSGNTMHVSYKAIGNKKPIKLEIPLKGFTKGYEALSGEG